MRSLWCRLGQVPRLLAAEEKIEPGHRGMRVLLKRQEGAAAQDTEQILPPQTGAHPSGGGNLLPLPGSCSIKWFGFLVFLATTLFAGCTSFDQLTRIPTAGEAGPTAGACGSCHIQQHLEWQRSVHAQASTSRTFLEAAGDPPGEDCLRCHRPLGVRDGQWVSRAFNREEGITCISCHLVDGAMHGPHGSTALVSPHPIREERTAFASPALCAPCHGETHEQWHQATAHQPAPTCQECHQASVQRTVTQGTNLFSNLLVAFEKKETTRSHDINLERMARFPGGLTLTVSPQPPGASVLEVTVRNNLPHDLPTGTYGSKEIRLILVAGREERRLSERSWVIGTDQQALAPGGAKTVRISLVGVDLQAAPLRLDLERHSESFPDRNPITLASLPIDAAAEAQP